MGVELIILVVLLVVAAFVLYFSVGMTYAVARNLGLLQLLSHIFKSIWRVVSMGYKPRKIVPPVVTYPAYASPDKIDVLYVEDSEKPGSFCISCGMNDAPVTAKNWCKYCAELYMLTVHLEKHGTHPTWFIPWEKRLLRLPEANRGERSTPKPEMSAISEAVSRPSETTKAINEAMASGASIQFDMVNSILSVNEHRIRLGANTSPTAYEVLSALRDHETDSYADNITYLNYDPALERREQQILTANETIRELNAMHYDKTQPPTIRYVDGKEY